MRRLCVVWFVLAAVACSSKSKTEGDNAPAKVPKEERSAVGAGDGGERAVVAIALWPKHWAAVEQAAAALGTLGGAPAAEALGELGLASAWGLPARLFGALRWREMAAPLDALDETGAIVLEVLPAPARFEDVALAAFNAEAGKLVPIAMWPRFRVTLPATDAGAMAGAIVERAKAATFAELTAGALYASNTLLVRVTRFPDAVVLDLVSGGGFDGLDDAARTAYLGAAPTAPPAPAFEQSRASAMRMVVRADEIGDLGSSSGMIKVAGVLAAIDPSRRSLLLLEGTSEAMVGYLVMDPATSVASASLLDVPADPKAAPRMALVLTDAGAAVLDAAGLADGKTAAVTSLDWEAALANVELSPILTAVDGPKDVAELFYECGWSCWTHVLLGNALQLARPLGSIVALNEVVDGARSEAPALFDALARARLTRSGRILVMGGDGDTAGLDVKPHSGPAPSAKAATCYRKALVGVREAFHAVVMADPSQKRVRLHEGKSGFDAEAACAQADPIIAARYRATKALLDAVIAKIEQR